MTRISIIALLVIASCHKLCAQNYLPKDTIADKVKSARHYLWDKGSSFTSQSNLFEEIDMSAYELVSGNLSFSDKDQAQKLVISPFKMLNETQKLGLLVNTKFNLTLKDKITTVGMGFAFDNSSYYSKRALRTRERIFCDQCLTVPGLPGVPDDNYDLYLQRLVRSLLDSTSLKGITDSSVIKITRERNRVTLDSLYNFYHTKAFQAVFEKYQKEKLAVVNKQFDSLLLAYDKEIAKNVLKWTIGYNFQLFPNLFSQGSANDFDSLNYHNVKSHNISGSITFSHNNNCLVLVTTYNQIFAYSIAEKTQKKVPYYGPAFMLSMRLFKFVPQGVLDTMRTYKKSLFVPSVNVGFSFEGKYADGATKYTEYYQDKTKRIVTWMPFVDLLFNPALQFRIGIPITRMRFPTGEKQTFAGANIQYNFKLSNLAL